MLKELLCLLATLRPMGVLQGLKEMKKKTRLPVGLQDVACESPLPAKRPIK